MEWVLRREERLVARAKGLLCALLLLGSSLSAQQLPGSDTLKKSVNLIQVPVIVRDRKGHAVTDLKATDFHLYDNGNPEAVTRFLYVQAGTGVNMQEENAAPEAVDSSRPSTSKPQNRTLSEKPDRPHILIVIPQLQFASRSFALQAVRKAAKEGLLNGAAVAIVDNSSIVLPFTLDRDSIINAIGKLQRVKESPCMGGPWIAAASERVSQMRSMPGRKFLVIFSDLGVDSQCLGIREFGTGNSPWQLLRLALSSDVAIYPVYARGVEPVILGGDASTPNYFGPEESAPSSLSQISGMFSTTSALASQAQLLSHVAAVTGGRVSLGNDLSHAFRLTKEDSSYYDIAYYLPDLQADGTYHRIRVEVNKPKLQLLAKAGYYAPIPFSSLSRGEKQQWLYRALLEDQPLGEIELTSRSSVFLNPSQPDITINAAIHAQWWVPKETSSDRRWTMLVGIVQNEQGTVVGRVQATNSWNAQRESEEENGYALQKATYNVLTQLKPGRYQLKVAVADLYNAVAGSCRVFFEVPRQMPTDVVASSMTLSRQWATELLNKEKSDHENQNPAQKVNRTENENAPDPLEVGDRRLIPSVDRNFPNHSEITMFLRFYPKSRNFPKGWKVTASLRDESGRRVITEAPAEVLSPTPAIPGIPVLHTFNLSKLKIPEGRYLAELEFIPPGQKRPIVVTSRFAVSAERVNNTTQTSDALLQH
ncbi:MAG TPA: VWA domain-containing protein [Terriglobales bacterium]|nr:VWA domain-containing protein [Terriglobales bacterium]